MKVAFFSFSLLFIPLTGSSQNIDFELDFSAVYWAPKSNDTIKIGVGKNGRYIFTDSKEIAKSFGNITRRFQPAKGKESADMKLLFDLKTTFMLMDIKVGQNTVMGHVDLSQFLNGGRSLDSTVVRTLKATPTALKIDNNRKKYKLYAVAPDHKPDDAIYMAFNEKYSVDYNTYFSKIMSSASGEQFNIDVPNGVLVYVEDKKGEIILELISIEKKKLKGSADLNLKLE